MAQGPKGRCGGYRGGTKLTVGQKEYAIRKAQESFDRWNDCTGLIPKFCSYYYEALAEIETACIIGMSVASGLDIKFDEGGELIDDDPLKKTKEACQA
jgi:hypothetical protein